MAVDVEEHKAVLHALMREEHEDFESEVRQRAEKAEAEGRVASARRHREHLARLEAIEKPWETRQAA